MPDIPPEAFTSARRAFIAHIGLHPSNVSEESLEAVDEAVAAAAPVITREALLALAAEFEREAAKSASTLALDATHMRRAAQMARNAAEGQP